MEKKHFVPFQATPVGEHIKDELDARGIKQKDFAKQIGIQASQLSEIIKGKRGINTELATLIGKALGINPLFWLNLQSKYELNVVKIEERNKKRLDAIGIWGQMKQYLDVDFFKREKKISGDPVIDIPVMHDIFNVKTIDELISLLNTTRNTAYFRKSKKANVEPIPLMSWQKLIEHESKHIKTGLGSFNHTQKEELLNALKEILQKNENTVANCKIKLAQYGIKFVHIPHPKTCAVDGLAFWSEGKPAIGMSIRYQRLDKFFFDLFHELGHIYLHLVNDSHAVYLDANEEGEKSEQELEADEFAKTALISKEEWKKFLEKSDKTSENEILAFAQKQKIHPAIVQGRLGYELKKYNLKVIDDHLN